MIVFFSDARGRAVFIGALGMRSPFQDRRSAESPPRFLHRWYLVMSAASRFRASHGCASLRPPSIQFAHVSSRQPYSNMLAQLKNRILIPSIVDVRFGSLAVICSAKGHVRFGPEADIVEIAAVWSSVPCRAVQHVKRKLQVAPAIALRLGKPPAVNVHLQCVQDEPRHWQRPVALFAQFHVTVF